MNKNKNKNKNNEKSVLDILNMLQSFVDDGMHEDIYIRDHMIDILKAGRALLNYDCGTLDAGACDGEFVAVANLMDFDLDMDEWKLPR